MRVVRVDAAAPVLLFELRRWKQAALSVRFRNTTDALVCEASEHRFTTLPCREQYLCTARCRKLCAAWAIESVHDSTC
jgi:hypothetical protein